MGASADLKSCMVSTARVRVRRTWRGPKFARCNGDEYRIVHRWRVFVDGAEASAQVVRCDWGLTIIGSTGEMLDCWHAGIAPGDLARMRERFNPGLLAAGRKMPRVP